MRRVTPPGSSSLDPGDTLYMGAGHNLVAGEFMDGAGGVSALGSKPCLAAGTEFIR
jgi:hypothetical protein